MKQFIDKARKTLEKNKIFLEVISLTILGISGVIFSYQQVVTSNREYELHKKEKSPLIRVTSDIRFNPHLEFYDIRELKIYNEGESLTDFNYEVYTFYLLTSEPKNRSGKKKQYYIPISDFYQLSFRTGEPTGLLLEAYNNNNNVEFHRAYSLLKPNDTAYLSIINYSVVKVVFKNILNEKITKYYEERLNTYQEIFKREFKRMQDISKQDFSFHKYRMDEIDRGFIENVLKGNKPEHKNRFIE